MESSCYSTKTNSGEKTKSELEQNIINCCDYIIGIYNNKNTSQKIKNEIKIDDIKEIRKRLDECFFLQKEEIELFKNYIYNLNNCINCISNPEYPLTINIVPEDHIKYFQTQTQDMVVFAEKLYKDNKIIQQNLKPQTANFDIHTAHNVFNVFDTLEKEKQDEIIKKHSTEFEIYKEELKRYTTLVNVFTKKVNGFSEYLDKYKLHFQIEANKFAREYEENKISNQVNIMSSMKSGGSMLSSINGANSKKMTDSIIMIASHLSDRIGTMEEEKGKSIQDTINAFIGLYNNYYNAQKRKTKDIKKQIELDQRNTEKKTKINSKNFKNCIEILLYPTEQDKEPNPKKDNKSNYDISLENFNSYVGNICKKYKVKNIEELITKENSINIKRFVRQIQMFQMYCVTKEAQEMFTKENLSASIFFN